MTMPTSTSTSTTRINAVTEFEKCAKKIFDVVVVVVVLVVVVEARSLSLSLLHQVCS